MTLYFVKGYLDVAATTLADAQSLYTALLDQSDDDNIATIDRVTAKVETLVQSDTGEPLTISSVDDAAGTISSWVTDPATSVAVAIGDPDINNNSIYANTTVDTIGATTRTGTLDLNTTPMAAAVSRGGGALRSRRFTLQIRKTTSGVTETMGLLSIRVYPTVVSATPTDLDPATYLTSAAAAAAYLPRGQSYNAQNIAAAANIAVAPAANAFSHVEIIGITGAAGSYNVVLSPTARSAGDLAFIQIQLPATSGLHANFYSGAAASAFFSFGPTDAVGDDLAVQCYYNGTAWRRFSSVAA